MSTRTYFLVLALVVWAIGVAAGMGNLVRYATHPGDSGKALARWPTESRIRPLSERPQLVMFIHPRCPCTRATIGELALIMSRCQAELDAYVLAWKPADVAPAWATTDLLNKAAAIPGVTVKIDETGVEARRFGAQTSGQTLLYAASGQLLFHGGVTGSRGHSGDNPGRSAVVELACSDAHRVDPIPHVSPVFGCPLFDRAEHQVVGD